MTVLMMIDATALFIWVFCAIILAQEDGSLTRFTRIPVLAVGAFAFAQALWLLGFWVAGPAGYPLPRVGLDGSVAVAFISRTATVLTALKRNSGRLLAARSFGRPFGQPGH